MLSRTRVLSACAALAGAALAGAMASTPARAAETVVVGDINSYTGIPQFTVPYRKGWQLALDEINANGGVLGKQLEVISRDDNGNPGDAVKRAEELVTRDEVALIMGTFFSNVGLAVADFADHRNVFFMAAEPLSDAIVWDKGNRYTFRLRPSTWMQTAMLVEEAADLETTRWATVAPNYKYGQDAVAAFQKLIKAERPDVEFVAEEWPPLFKIDAGSTAQSLLGADPGAIFNVTFGTDLAKFAREGELRQLFEGRTVVSLLTGEPEYLEPLGAETPEGWIVTGYPWYSIDTPQHQAFLDAYMNMHGEPPKMGSVVGYNAMKSVAAIIERAGSTDTDAMIEAAEGIEVSGLPTGPIRFRAIDHQSTMGAWVGRTTVEDGKGRMVDWHYADGADYLPSDEEVRAMRP